GTELVLVWAQIRARRVRRQDGERRFEEPRAPDTLLRRDQPHRRSLELEVLERRPRDESPGARGLLIEVGERSRSKAFVEIGFHARRMASRRPRIKACPPRSRQPKGRVSADPLREAWCFFHSGEA